MNVVRHFAAIFQSSPPLRGGLRAQRASYSVRSAEEEVALRATPPRSGGLLWFHGIGEPRATLLAHAFRLVAEESREQRRQLRDDVRDVGEFFVQLVPALLTVPLEPVHLTGLAL